MSTNFVSLAVYTSGYPNYFVYGVNHDTLETYSLLNNNVWVKSSTNLTLPELNRMLQIDVENGFYVQE